MLQHDRASERSDTETNVRATGAERPFQLLPAIDLRGGLVVRLSEGDFARQTAYSRDPVAVALGFVEAGARWIHVVDLDGARDGTRRQAGVVARIVAAVGKRVACQVAGGLRDEASVEAALAAGAARAVVGTAALDDPDLVDRLVSGFGADRIAIALDVRDGLAVGHGWVPGAAGQPVERVFADLADRGARVFVVTAIARDGLLGGPDTDLLRTMVELRRGEVVASAGVSSLEDLAAVRRIGCVGAVVGRAIYEGKLDLAAAVRLVGSSPAGPGGDAAEPAS
jgi:phosphoribosylformimino-5-aminoimidazole carboxamide ribotide isomerase